jgi:hypothetical protein
MDALGKLMRTMMWDNVDAEDCEEMFNVRPPLTLIPLDPNLSASVPYQLYLLERKTSSLTH